MSSIDAADAFVCLLANWHLRQLVATSADKVTKRMTAEGIPAKQECIHCQNDCAVSDAERCLTGGVSKPHRLPDIVQKNNDEYQSEVKKITMNVLQDERKGSLSYVSLSRLAYGARRRISPECLVISSAIVITGEAKAAGSPENDQRRRPWEPAWEPIRFWPKPAVGGITKQLRGVKRRQVRTKAIMVALERCPG